MARIRTIKPEFFTSEDVVSLSPLARLLYIALWCEADREGRMAWKPKTFKLRYLPADNCDADELANELLASGMVVLYGDGYAYIPAFQRHQHINPRESASTLPDPNASQPKRTRQHASARVNDASARDDDAQGGKEGKGKEGKGRMNTSAPDASGALCEFLPDVDAQVVRDWQAVRKAKRAGPITASVADGLRREALSAGITTQAAILVAVERGWQSFRAEWLAPQVRGSPINRQEAIEARNRAAGEEWLRQQEAIDASQ